MPKQASPSPLSLVLDQIWRALHALGGSPDALGGMTDQALAYLGEDRGDDWGDDPDADRQASRAAYVLAEAAASSSDNALIKKALQALPSLGPPGEMLAASLLGAGRVQDQVLKMSLEGLPANRLLAVINRFLARPRGADPKLPAWAAQTVHDLQGEDTEEVLLLLADLARRGERPAYAVQRELLHGRFGFWLQELLGLDLDADQAKYTADTASRLDWPPLTGRLLRLLKFCRPEDLPGLFDLVHPGWSDPNGRTAKAALLFLKHKDTAVRVAAARALVRMASPGAAKALAGLYAAAPASRPGLLGVVLTMRPRDFLLFAKTLPAALRTEALAGLAAALARLDPERLKGQAKNGPAGAALAGLAKGRKRDDHGPAFTPLPPEPRREARDDGPSLLGKVKRMMGGQAEADDPGRRLLDGLGKGAALKGDTIKDAEAPGRAFTGVAFDGCTLGRLDLGQGTFSGVRFTGCRLTGVDFSGSRFKKTEFAACDLTACRFSACAMQEVRFTGCSLARCHLDAALTSKLRLEDCSWEEGSLWGARLEEAEAKSCRFALADFSFAALVRADFDGIEFADCAFTRTFVADSRLMNAVSRAAALRGCDVRGLTSDEPCLLRQAESSLEALARDAAEQAKPAAPPAALADEKGQRLMLALVEGWLHERELLRRWRRTLAANRRRLEWCRAKLGADAGRVLEMLPGLLEAGAVIDADGQRPATACRVLGWTPGLAAKRDLDAHFGGPWPAPSEDSANAPAIRVEAFYSIGSVGTIAQSRHSDIDMWVCFDESKVKPEDVRGLKAKLAAIEAWGEREHGLELHFFVMDMDAVRRNNFGFSDKESAGSSQALLLKEEFYRTAVLLAGRKLAWWLMAPTADEAVHARELKRIAAAPSLPRGEVVDLGAMTPIPADEFFGASLWQIVKALKSPFKSIMKFAVLDKYLAGAEGDALICDRIRRNIHTGRVDFWGTDPYAVLYFEVESHYAAAGDADARELMHLAFEQKTGYSDQSRTSGRAVEMRGHSWLEYFFPYSLDQRPGGPPAPGAQTDDRSFARLNELGRMVTRYMFGTYQRISEGVAKTDAAARISGEDLTKLGRKIFGHFKDRPSKVPRVPFLDKPRSLFSALEIVCEGRPGTPRTWLATGESAGGGKKGQTEELRREKHPVALLAWVVANRLFEGSMAFRGVNLQAPISTPDLRALLDALMDCFPAKTVFEPEIEETLRDEEMTRAFICVNFLADREVREIRDATLVYATNWGELFCVTKPKGMQHLEKDVTAFLQANTDGLVAPDVRLATYYPKKSLAPRIVEI